MLDLSREKQPPKFLVFIFLLGICSLLYASALRCGFMLDSHHVIANNPTIKQPALYKNIFTKDFFAPYKKLEEVKLNYYRPVVLLTYIIDYKFWRLNAGGYHFTNILIHSLNGFLLYIFLLKFFKTNRAAFLGALFFCILPVQEWNINEIAGRTSLLQLTFSLLSLIKFVNFYETRRKAVFVLSLVYFILAILSREIALFFPLLIFLLGYFTSRNCKKTIQYTLPFLFVSVGYIVWRHYFLPIISTQQSLLQNFSVGNIYEWLVAVFSYLCQFVLPRKQAISNFINLENNPLKFMAAMVMSFVGAIFLFKKLNRQTGARAKEILFLGGLWVVIGFLPLYFALPQFEYLGPILSEAYFYLPSIGFSIILSYMICAFPREKYQKIFVILLSAYYFILVFYDNSFYKNEETLLRHFTTLEGKRNSLIAEQLFLKYDFDPLKAQEKVAVSTAVEEKSNWLVSLGIYYFERGLYSEAGKFFAQANQFAANAAALRGLGAVYFKTKQFDLALQYLNKSLALNPESNFSYRILGMVYYVQDRFLSAAAAFRQAVFFNPDDLTSWLYLGMAHFWDGNTALSQQAFAQAVHLSGDQGYVLRFAAVQIYNHGQTGYAVYFLEKAMTSFPDDEQTLLLLGKMYFNLGELNKAFRLWEKVLQLNAHNQEARDCLSQKEKMNLEIPGNKFILEKLY